MKSAFFLPEIWRDRVSGISGFYIFGAGKLGQTCALSLNHLGGFLGFVDNDADKRVKNRNIFSVDEYLKRRDGMIAICLSERYEAEVVEQLQENGLIEDVDYCVYETFRTKLLPAWGWYVKNEVVVAVTQLTLTERCTLRCRKCAHACYAVKANHSDMKLEMAKLTVDNYFKVVDYLQEFVLIGGEPMLYNDLSDIISYIGENYRNKIGILSITTNGTILPNDSLLQVAVRYDVLFNISNYEHSIPSLSNKHKLWREILDSRCIRYSIGSPEITWIDYGFEDYQREKEEDLCDVFDRCNTICHEMRGDRFYFCVMARAVSDNLCMGIGIDDFFSLSVESESNIYSKKEEFMCYLLGYSDKGFLDMCGRCRGRDAVNYQIQAAEQMRQGWER